MTGEIEKTRISNITLDFLLKKDGYGFLVVPISQYIIQMYQYNLSPRNAMSPMVFDLSHCKPLLYQVN